MIRKTLVALYWGYTVVAGILTALVAFGLGGACIWLGLWLMGIFQSSLGTAGGAALILIGIAGLFSGLPAITPGLKGKSSGKARTALLPDVKRSGVHRRRR